MLVCDCFRHRHRVEAAEIRAQREAQIAAGRPDVWKRHKAAALLSAEQRALLRTTAVETRQLAHAAIVASGIVPSAISSVYGADSLLYEAVSLVKEQGETFGAHGTVDRDSDAALAVLKSHLADQIRDTYGAIVTDGATLKHEKAVCVLYSTHQRKLKRPILLAVVFPDGATEDGDTVVYNFEKAAADIAAVADQFGINVGRQCTCLMGDNVTFNDALAVELGIDRAKCMPHAISLVGKHGSKHVPLLRALVRDASAVINAGGTSKRVAQLRSPAYNLDANRMKMYPNRFVSIVDAAAYRLSRFEDVKRWHTTSTLLPAPSDERSDSDDDETEDKAKKASKQAMAAAAAYNSEYAQLSLIICSELFGELPEFVKELSSDDLANVRPNIMEVLNQYYFMLEKATKKTGAHVLIEAAIGKLDGDLDPAFHESAKKFFTAGVMAAATAAMKKYDDHITPMHFVLERRFRYDPRFQPVTAKDEEMDKNFFGCLQHQLTLKLQAQYETYVRTWKAVDPKTCPVDYWLSKRAVWPDLANIALYWSEYPTSAVSAERVFAVMRASFVPMRESMTPDHLARELMFKVNKPVLDELLEAKLIHFRALLQRD
jgi:hypothetical protein